jgi:hypothetical protein
LASQAFPANGMFRAKFRRLIDDGMISRFVLVEMSKEEIHPERTLMRVWVNLLMKTFLSKKVNAFYSKYKFELYSNFTFFPKSHHQWVSTNRRKTGYYGGNV